jgi:hypothetical protein
MKKTWVGIIGAVVVAIVLVWLLFVRPYRRGEVYELPWGTA